MEEQEQQHPVTGTDDAANLNGCSEDTMQEQIKQSVDKVPLADKERARKADNAETVNAAKNKEKDKNAVIVGAILIVCGICAIISGFLNGIVWAILIGGTIEFAKGLPGLMEKGIPGVEEDEEQRALRRKENKRTFGWMLGILALIAVVVGLMVYRSNKKHQENAQKLIEQREKRVIEQYDVPVYTIDEKLLEQGEISDGYIIYKRPSNCKMQKLPKGDHGYIYTDRNQKFGVVVATSKNDGTLTQSEFDEAFETNKPSWAKKFNETVISENADNSGDRHVFERKSKFTREGYNTSYWVFVIVQDDATKKHCTFAGLGEIDPSQSIIEIQKSLRFYNKVE